MSRERVAFEIGTSVEHAVSMCTWAAQVEGLRVEQTGPDRLLVGQPMNFTTYTITLDVRLIPTGGGTTVQVDALVNAYGPIQSRGLREGVARFQARVLDGMGRAMGPGGGA